MEIDYCDTAVKYGRTYEYYNEVCYVDSESPYIIVIMSKTNNDDERKYGDEKFFRSVAECADKINAVSQVSEIDIYDKGNTEQRNKKTDMQPKAHICSILPPQERT